MILGVTSTSECQYNVNCNSSFDDVKRATALFSMNGTSCTGQLINNLANEQYFLIATHCLADLGSPDLQERLSKSAKFFFNAETDSCESNSGPSNDQIDVSDKAISC